MHSPFPLYAPDQLRELEARGIASCGGDAFALMARAGLAAWHCVLKHWSRARRILVVCGPGNNGGDGYVLARHALSSGIRVQVLRLDAHAPRTPLARRAHDAFIASGGQVACVGGELGDADLLVDALFGIGLSRAPDDSVSALIEAMSRHPAPVLALDVPSGIDARSGDAPGAAVVADRTLQFIARHRGLRTGAALDHAGDLQLASLDLPATVFDGIDPAAFALRADALPGFFPLRPRDSHKGRNGHVLCIGGDHGSGGAILLAADAALRSGAGLLSVATRAEHVPALLARRPEAMVHGVDDAAQLAPLLSRAGVIAIGPGLGQGDWGRGLLDLVLANDAPGVVDADALNLLASSGQRLRAQDVATPHPGEAARLLGIPAHDVQRDRFAAAQALHERLGCTVVLKGAGSIIASPDRAPTVICAGNPGMAVGGMGDVLTGVIAALLAQGMPAGDAAIAGALLHAAAGDAAAREDGERGLLPSDLLPWLRRLANPMRR
ncbi:NAD(P)H-hydrate dehydratase [Thermomonas carbonis]|uniref:Bifunctional NAD(P)H-hydrate repair enzyme n=1 Tax=Thermomonas carbonis TaxID=1463158 RepID=A0A7G9SQ53_9GAMM|nr:NAD(P)H-hydrate dehydratase [Thermomonas carbonis]QNN69978.1 NAD(P)H-hydrate dehydratase [Thermomonas carbonis]GHB96793.1 bifunctional NAD(P)H-hydrate repair enzyme [Thermomonas carbonis]